MDLMSKRLNWKWYLMCIVIVLTIGAGGIILLFNTPEKRVQRQLALGERFISEEDYGQAAEAYEKALTIDDECEKAYLGAAKAYAEADNYEKAQEILEKGYETTQSNEIENRLRKILSIIMLPLQAEELTWVSAPVYEYEDVEPIHGESFSDLGPTAYSDGTEGFFNNQYFCEMSFSGYSNLPEYYNVTINGIRKLVYMPLLLEYEIPLEQGAIRYDSSGLCSFPLNENDFEKYFGEKRTPWNVLTSAERGTSNGAPYFDTYSGQVYFYVDYAPEFGRGIKPMQELGLHKPYPVGKMDTSPAERTFSEEIIWNAFEEFPWDFDTQNSLFAYADQEGNLITDFLYEDAEDFSEGIAACCKDGKWGYIDETGQEITEFVYDAQWNDFYAYPCTNDTIVVSKDGQMGVLYRDGTLLIDYGQFEDLAPAWNDQLWAKQDGKWGLIDLADAKQKAGYALTDTEPSPSYTWQEAYITYLTFADEKEEFGGYVLIYVDDDEIPELVDVGDSEAEGCKIISFTNGKLQKTQLNRLEFTYLEGEGLFNDSSEHMGECWDLVYQVQDGLVTQIGDGHCYAFDDDYTQMEFDENNMPIYRRYLWNGEEVSKEEYAQALGKIYDVERSKEGYIWNDCDSADEMIQTLKNWK